MWQRQKGGQGQGRTEGAIKKFFNNQKKKEENSQHTRLSLALALLGDRTNGETNVELISQRTRQCESERKGERQQSVRERDAAQLS